MHFPTWFALAVFVLPCYATAWRWNISYLWPIIGFGLLCAALIPADKARQARFPHKATPSTIILRAYVVTFLCFMPIHWLLDWEWVSVPFHAGWWGPLSDAFWGGIVIVIMLMGQHEWGLGHLDGTAHLDDWDSLPWPFNPDTRIMKEGGENPWVEHDWLTPCPHCGAKVLTNEEMTECPACDGTIIWRETPQEVPPKTKAPPLPEDRISGKYRPMERPPWDLN